MHVNVTLHTIDNLSVTLDSSLLIPIIDMRKKDVLNGWELHSESTIKAHSRHILSCYHAAICH